MKEKIKDISDIDLHIIYIAADYETRKHRALKRRKDKVHDFEKRCEAEDSQFIDFECSQAWNKRIQNVDFNKAVLELEQYIIINNNLEEQ